MKLLKFYPSTTYLTTALLILMISASSCSKKRGQSSKMNKDKMAKVNQQSSVHHKFAAPIEKAQKMKKWNKKGVLKAHITQQFEGHKGEGTMYIQTAGPGVRLELGGDTVAVFDGQHMWAAPNDSAVSRFQLKTWGYFLKAPYKLNDPGTHITTKGTAKAKGHTYDTAKLTFDPGTGDTPKDWFILYRNQQTNRLEGMAFIVTNGKSTVKQASKHPEGISYENWKSIAGIPIATAWEFWHWNNQKGFSDQPIGHAKLTNVKFVKAGDLFSKPQGAMKMKQ